ncbi:MAG: type II toxin-antitoxin system prevent-host-death family antitoxin [Bacilli bacterium]|nr:type II toxin-antitoxin system prevent-host-death family antitoxin [Bacilli bacterium]
MIATNYTTARNNLKKFMDHARDNYEPVIITGKGGNSVLMSEEEYNNLMENLFIMSNPAMVAHLKESMAQLASGEVIEKTIDELKAMEDEGQ